MKTSHVTFALAAATVASAQIEKVPKCALDCLMDGLGESKCDNTLDLECQCGQADGLVGKVVPCVRGVCDFDEQKEARDLAIGVCKSFGISISLPPPSSATGTSDPTASESSGGSSTMDTATATTTDAETSATDEATDTTPTATDGDETETSGSPTASDTSAPADNAGSSIKADVGGGMAAALLAVAAYL